MCENDPTDYDDYDEEKSIIPNTIGYGGDDYVKNLKSVKRYPNTTRLTSEILKKNINDATLYESELVNVYAHKLTLHQFLGVDVVTQSFQYSKLNANIFRYGLMKLRTTNKLELFSFDASAALSKLEIGHKQYAPIPAKGYFVLKCGKDKVVLYIYPLPPASVGFEVFGTSYEVTDRFIKMCEEAAKSNNFYKGKVFSSDGTFLDIPKLTLDDVVLPENIKKEIQSNVVEFLNRTLKIFEFNKLPTKRGLIFAGAPGTGKTHLAKTIAATTDATFISITDLPYPEAVKSVYQFARQTAPTILLFEDIDTYFDDRRDRRFATLLNEMDGLEENKALITIITTNRKDFLDKAIRERPGRFDRILNFQLPDTTLVKHMLTLFTKDVKTPKVNFEKVAKEFVTKKYTGAHVKEAVLTACISATQKMRRKGKIKITTEDLLAATVSIESAKVPRTMGFTHNAKNSL